MLTSEHDYRTGRWVGEIIGALKHGCRSMAGTWPEAALPEDRKDIEQLCETFGLVPSFEGRSLTIREREKPTLTIVN